MDKKESVSNDHVSYTALKAAAYRAIESKKAEPLFKDYFAERFINDQKVDSQILDEDLSAWTLVMRTYLLDKYIEKLVEQGIDSVLNLGAGLDTRPYRLNIHKDVRWIEVDYNDIISFKEQRLAGEKPNCELHRIAIDLSDQNSRKDMLNTISSKGTNMLVLSEGLLMYLSSETVISIARELYSINSVDLWMMDITNKPFIEWAKGHMLKNRNTISANGYSIRFYPDNTAEFMRSLNWNLEAFTSYAQCGINLNRAPKGFTPTELSNESGLQEIGIGIFSSNTRSKSYIL